MKAQVIFRLLLIIQMAFGLSIVLLPGLNLDIQQYANDLITMLVWKTPIILNERSFFLNDDRIYMLLIVGSFLMMTAIISFLAGLIGSFFYKKWGRYLLVATAIISLIAENVVKLIGDFPTHSMCHEGTAAAFYVAITMSFLPPICHLFEAKPKMQLKHDTQ